MTHYYGAETDLKKLINTHLFVICANNSGTTFLRNALATSNRTWNLFREGQHTFGFAGPSSIGLKAGKRWASNDYWINIFTDPKNYDWEAIKKTWYFQAWSKSDNARVLIEKSPPFLLIVDQLNAQFRGARFLFMVRNPYAVVEGVRRKSPIRWKDSIPKDEVLNVASTHVINCLRYQRENVKKWSDQGVLFSYEQMCEKPENVEDMIRGLVPEIDDLVLRQRIPVKQYNEELRNMNDQQIERLSVSDIGEINKVFSQYPDVMEFFNYSIL